MPHTVLIVEDDEPTRARLAEAVGAHPELEVVGRAGCYAEGARLLRSTAPDVLLVDLGLPDASGARLIRETRALSADTRVMVITVFADERHVMEAVEAGARGYLLKDGSAEYVARSILELISGSSPISPAIARHLLNRFQARAQAEESVTPDRAAPQLTEREREVLSLLAKGFTFEEISRLLGISAHTVTTHVRHIYRKLEVGSRSQAVYEAVSLGLLRLDD
jgi:DNA-binding NarL/FixJ family response regulator